MIRRKTTSGLEIFIQVESPEEHEKVNELIRLAFANDYGLEEGAKMRDYFANERKETTFIPELSLVAYLTGGEMVGQIALYETDIITATSKNTQLVLSHCAVSPDYRFKGIMRELIRYALVQAREMGYVAVFLGGPADLYGKFGFEPSYRYGIYHEKCREIEGYIEGYMVHILVPGGLDGVTGTTSYYGG